MKAWWQQALNYWAQLRPREQLLLSLGAVVGLAAALFLLAWEPVMQERQRLEQSVAEQRQLVAWLQQAAREVEQLRQSKPAANGNRMRGGRSLLALIDSTAKQGRLGEALKRVEPDGSGRVRVWLDEAAFDDLVRWLGQLRQRYAVQVDSIAIDKDERRGRVNARVVFSGAAS